MLKRKGNPMADKKTMKPAKMPRFTQEEQAAMKARVDELKAESEKVDGESALIAKIAEMPPADRALAQKFHTIVKAAAPELTSKTWYGMPAYANAEGKVICYFRAAYKFKERYA